MSDEKADGGGAAERGGADPKDSNDAADRSGLKGTDKSDSPTMSKQDDLLADRSSRAAYEGGRHLLSPLTIQASRDAHIHIDKRIMSGLPGFSAAPGPVPIDQIELLRARYVAVPDQEDMRLALREHRLLVLLGTKGSGRSTTGLYLLDELAGGAVARLDPRAGAPLGGAGQIESGHGYLASVDQRTAPGRVAADRLAADLAAQNAYCVLTAPASPGLRRELGFYCVGHTQADSLAILRQHVQAGVRPEDDDDLATRMAALVGTAEIARLLGGAARPTEAAQVAGLLLAHGRGERSRDEVDALAAQLVLDDRIEEWFSVLVGVSHGQQGDRARRLTAMRIAVAVFDGLPRHIAESAAEPLAQRIGMPPEPPGDAAGIGQMILPRTGPRGVDPEEIATLLDTTPIAVDRREVPFGSRSVPGEIISYRDERLPSAVLRCVWQNHYPLRAPVIAWLEDLSRDDHQQVRFRAAQAAGLLCALDFSHTLDALVLPAAKAQPKVDPHAIAAGAEDDEDDDENEEQKRLGMICLRRRQFAAMVMDHVARDERLRRVVRVMLRRWRRDADPAMRWTAARAYAYDIGARDPALAFDELRVLGTPWELHPYPQMKRKERRQEESIFHAAGAAVADMFGSGAHREVLAVLSEWSMDPRWSIRLLALQAIVCLVPMMATTIGTPDAAGARVDLGHVHEVPEPLLDDADRELRARWPVLIALHGRQPELQRQGAELIRFALRSREQKVVLGVFGDIFDIADEDPAALSAVEAFLPLLIKDESDRGRLIGLLRRMRDAWADPLSADVAARLEEVIVGIPVVTGRKVFT